MGEVLEVVGVRATITAEEILLLWRLCLPAAADELLLLLFLCAFLMFKEATESFFLASSRQCWCGHLAGQDKSMSS